MRFIPLALGFVLLCMIPAQVTAEVFVLGEKESEMYVVALGRTAAYFDDGSWVIVEEDYLSYMPSIFDGDTNTGIDHYFGAGHSDMNVRLEFPNDTYVNFITVDPTFGGSASDYIASLILPGGTYLQLNTWSTTERTFHINGTIRSFYVFISNSGTDQFNFNDVIINFTPRSDEFASLAGRVDTLESDVGNLTARVDGLEARVDEMSSTVTEMKLSLDYVNVTQTGILTQVTSLWTAVDALNASVTNLTERMDALPQGSGYDAEWIESNITDINAELDGLKADMYDMQKDIEGVPDMDPGAVSALDARVNDTVMRLGWVNDNITALWAALPEPFDATNMTGRLDDLEAENAALRQEVDDLNGKVDELEKDAEGGGDDSDVMPILYLLGVGIIVIAVLMVISMMRGGGRRRDEEEEEEPTAGPVVKPMVHADVVGPQPRGRKLSATPASVVDVDLGGEAAPSTPTIPPRKYSPDVLLPKGE